MVVPLCRTQSAFFNNQRYPSHSLAHPPLSQAKRQRLTTQLWLLTILLNIEKGRFFQNRVLYKTTKGSLLNAFFFFQSIYFFSFYHIHSVFMCNDESNLDKKKQWWLSFISKPSYSKGIGHSLSNSCRACRTERNPNSFMEYVHKHF